MEIRNTSFHPLSSTVYAITSTLILPFSLITDNTNPFTRSVKILYAQRFQRKTFDKKFPAYIKQYRSAYKTFYATCKQGFSVGIVAYESNTF